MAMSRREFARRSAAGLVLLGIGARAAEADGLLRNQVCALREAVRSRADVQAAAWRADRFDVPLTLRSGGHA